MLYQQTFTGALSRKSCNALFTTTILDQDKAKLTITAMKRSSGVTCDASAAAENVGSLVFSIWEAIHREFRMFHKPRRVFSIANGSFIILSSEEIKHRCRS